MHPIIVCNKTNNHPTHFPLAFLVTHRLPTLALLHLFKREVQPFQRRKIFQLALLMSIISALLRENTRNTEVPPRNRKGHYFPIYVWWSQAFPFILSRLLLSRRHTRDVTQRMVEGYLKLWLVSYFQIKTSVCKKKWLSIS